MIWQDDAEIGDASREEHEEEEHEEAIIYLAQKKI